MTYRMTPADLDRSLRTAIQERRLVAFILYGEARLMEPHDYGLIAGEPRLFCYQVGGGSRSGRPHGWRWAPLSEISQFHVLDERFRGARPVPSGKHIKWNTLFASVSSKHDETNEA
jgi:hypothetical protein